MQNAKSFCDEGITSASNLQVSRNIIPCPNCGSKSRELGDGKGLHSASLRCAVCARFIKWIGKAELAKIQQSQGGQN